MYPCTYIMEGCYQARKSGQAKVVFWMCFLHSQLHFKRCAFGNGNRFLHTATHHIVRAVVRTSPNLSDLSRSWLPLSCYLRIFNLNNHATAAPRHFCNYTRGHSLTGHYDGASPSCICIPFLLDSLHYFWKKTAMDCWSRKLGWFYTLMASLEFCVAMVASCWPSFIGITRPLHCNETAFTFMTV